MTERHTKGVNSYVTLAEANALADTRLFAGSWDAATDDTRERALITATALLDRLQWKGRPLVATQPLAWPRAPDARPYGYPLTTDIPQGITTATVELAIHLLSVGQFAGAPVQQRMLGDSMVMYLPTVADEFPKHVRRAIEPHLCASSANVAEVQF
ncbi:MAG: hypothetical protein JKY97_12200 [Citromicrobium sp.]|nr:hypothetical protein [Citromicrobium sp.]